MKIRHSDKVCLSEVWDTPYISYEILQYSTGAVTLTKILTNMNGERTGVPDIRQIYTINFTVGEFIAFKELMRQWLKEEEEK